MKKYLIPVLSAIAIALSATPILLLLESDLIYLAGIGPIFSYLMYGYIKQLMLREGRTESRKRMESLMSAVIPLLAVSTTAIFGAVQKEIGIPVLLGISIAMIQRRDLSLKMSRSFSLKIGTGVWIGIISIGILLSFYRPYFVFYSMILLGLVVLIDILWLISESIRN